MYTCSYCMLVSIIIFWLQVALVLRLKINDHYYKSVEYLRGPSFFPMKSHWRVQYCDVPSPGLGTRGTGGRRCARWTPRPQSARSRESDS